MEIRPATTGEVETVLALWRDADTLPSATDDEEGVRRIAGQGSLLVAVKELGTVVGTLIAAFDGWRGNMYRLAVTHEQRRRGVARALIEAGEASLSSQGCRRVTALVAYAEPDAVAFWRAVGYGHDRRMTRYVKMLTHPRES